jgi:hypothetical protein
MLLVCTAGSSAVSVMFWVSVMVVVFALVMHAARLAVSLAGQFVAFAGVTSREILMGTAPNRDSRLSKVGTSKRAVDPVFTKALRQSGRIGGTNEAQRSSTSKKSTMCPVSQPQILAGVVAPTTHIFGNIKHPITPKLMDGDLRNATRRISETLKPSHGANYT